MKIDKARELALKILYQIEIEKGYSNLVLDEYIEKNREKLTVKDISLISELVYGVVTWKLTIDTVIQKYSKTKLNKISDWVLMILRIGVYQILFLDKIPKSAAVNEAVNLCKKYGYKSTSFVNAILRKVEKQDYEALKQIENRVERFSKVYSMPEWFIKKLLEEQEEKVVEDILKHSNEKPVLTIRINSLKTTKEDLVKELNKQEISCQEANLSDFLYVNKVKNIAGGELFKEGKFTVQDEGAGEIAFVVAPKPGQMVLDACSAPGGKTTYLAELMKNQGHIIAWDLHEHRTKLVEENAQRLGISIIETQTRDATCMQEEYLEKFDKILLDVPCLGFGVLKRKPDIKWQRKQEDVQEITNLQLAILKTCSKYLKVGGELVYSTCSILKEENEKIVELFLKQDIVEESRMQIKWESIFEKNILPAKTTDGFYINKIRRLK